MREKERGEEKREKEEEWGGEEVKTRETRGDDIEMREKERER